MIFVSAIFGHHQAAVIHQFDALVALVLDFDGKPYNVVAVELQRAWLETDLRCRNDDVLEEFDLLHQRSLLSVFERRGVEEAHDRAFVDVELAKQQASDHLYI